MRAHLEAYGISPEFVAADNHRANGLAERVIRDFNDIMNLTCKDHWKTWHKTIKDTELSLRTNPNEDTGISPAEFLFGRPMRTTFGGLPGLVDLEEDTPRRVRKARGRTITRYKQIYGPTTINTTKQTARIHIPTGRTGAIQNSQRWRY